MSASRALRIGLLLYPGCTPAGLFAFADLLHGANRLAGRALFEGVFVAARAGAVPCAHGQVLEAAQALARADLDAVLVPAFLGESTAQVSQTLQANFPLVQALRQLPKATALWSYCTGVALLAEAGRLRHQPATITWWLAEPMRQRHPAVQWQTERTCAWGPHAATASGMSGHQLIAQGLIEARLGPDAWRSLSRLMVLPRPERSHPAFDSLNLMAQSDPLLRRLHGKAQAMPASALTVARLARELHTTERTLARRIRAAAGVPVASYVRQVKLHQVSERLVYTRLPATTICGELGFSTESAMRRMFKGLTGYTPARYRQAFSRV